MGANFQPEVYPYKETGSFRFWCQKVLPLVYDDSLSYYELLCKVVKYLNDVIANVDGLHDDVLSTNQAFYDLQNFVNDYFADLDVQSEINAKLDAMAVDGSLTELLTPIVGDMIGDVVGAQISDVVASQIDDVVGEQIGAVVSEEVEPYVAPIVTDWLNTNVDPVGSAVTVDSSLRIGGSAADAEVVGDWIYGCDERTNIFEIADQTISGVTITNLGNGVIKINGTASEAIHIELMTLTGEYTASYRVFDGGISSDNYIRLAHENSRWVSYSPLYQVVTVTLTNEKIYLDLSNGAVYTNFICQFIINSGDKIVDFRGIQYSAKDKTFRFYDIVDDIVKLKVDMGANVELITDGIFDKDVTWLNGGTWRQFAGYYTTDFIKVIPGATLTYTLAGFHSTTVTLDSIAFFDKELKYISGIYKEATSQSATTIHGTTIVPNNAYYAVFMNQDNIANSSVIMTARGATNKVGFKIGFIGDSLTQGSTGGTPPTIDWASKPYPTVFKEFLEKTNYEITVKNFGRRGLSAVTYWEKVIPSDGQYHSPADGEPGDTFEIDDTFDAIVIMLGTNGHLDNNTIEQDTQIEEGQTYLDYADTQCGDYCKIIEYVMEYSSNNAQIILVAPVYANASGYERKIINTLPTIKALGERYQIPVINATFESGIGKFNKSVFYNQSDLLHLNQLGYTKLGSFIASKFISMASKM